MRPALSGSEGRAIWSRLSATPASRQRLLQVLLGVIWLVDGVLQLQPAMFGRRFVTGVLLPTAQGNPHPVAASITAMAHFLEPHIALWNALFAAIQLLIGLGLLVRGTVRLALVGSFAWALLVWWFAEGLGGLFAGTASPLSGAPGAALIYIVVGLLVWPRREADTGLTSAASGSLLGDAGARAACAVLWIGSAALLLQPANLSKRALSGTLAAAGAGQPSWYAKLLLGAASALGSSGAVLAVGITVAVGAWMASVGFGAALGRRTRGVLVAATLVGLLIWVFPEGLGGVLTGQGTDPNTGPLLVLAGLAWYWSPSGASTSSSTAPAFGIAPA
ncbi:MAG: hypothetical protein ACYDGN_08790 [Acidimicrobiales bacterium]